MENIVTFPTKKSVPEYVEQAWQAEVDFIEARFNKFNVSQRLRRLFYQQYRDAFMHLMQMNIEVIVFDEDNPSHKRFIELQEDTIRQIFAYRAKVIEDRRLLEMRLFINQYAPK